MAYSPVHKHVHEIANVSKTMFLQTNQLNNEMKVYIHKLHKRCFYNFRGLETFSSFKPHVADNLHGKYEGNSWLHYPAFYLNEKKPSQTTGRREYS